MRLNPPACGDTLLPQPETSTLADYLPRLQAVVHVVISAEGAVLAANAGFYRLLGRAGATLAEDCSALLVGPTLAELLHRASGAAEGEQIHTGLFNFTNEEKTMFSLPGAAWWRGSRIELVAEYPVEEHERLLSDIIALNEEITRQQRETICANRDLKRSEATLTAEVARREAVELDLRREKAEQAVLLEKLGAAQSQLLQAEKLASVGRLAAGVAHEINNPIGFVTSNLNSLGGYVNDLLGLLDLYAEAAPLLTDHPALQSRLQQATLACDLEFLREDSQTLANESRQGLARVKRIVQDLKDFSRVDESAWQQVDLHACLESALNVNATIREQDPEIVRNYAELPLIHCCPGLLNQVFANLLGNAAEAMPPPGRLNLTSGAEEDQVWIEIGDNGRGIAPELLDRIFDPFYTTKPVGQGTGLGLSVAWNIVREHHGRIQVDSLPGQGTRIRVCLPITQPAGEELAAPV